MTNTQLAEILLLRLYEHAETAGHGSLVELNAVAAELGETDVMKIYTLSKLLRDRGLTEGRFSLGGRVRASITGAGALFVESGGATYLSGSL